MHTHAHTVFAFDVVEAIKGQHETVFTFHCGGIIQIVSKLYSKVCCGWSHIVQTYTIRVSQIYTNQNHDQGSFIRVVRDLA